MKREVFGGMQGTDNVDGVRVWFNVQEAQVEEGMEISAQKNAIADVIRVRAAIWTNVRGFKNRASRTTGYPAGSSVSV